MMHRAFVLPKIFDAAPAQPLFFAWRAITHPLDNRLVLGRPSTGYFGTNLEKPLTLWASFLNVDSSFPSFFMQTLLFFLCHKHLLLFVGLPFYTPFQFFFLDRCRL